MVQGKTNLKYILIVVVLVAIAGGGILAYQYWWLPKQETKPPGITIKDGTAQNPPETRCIDSDAQCEGKPDGTSCTMGVWCDESGNVCGGESCVGLGMGECSGEKCALAKDEIADWKTYRNEEYGFEVKYPSSLVPLENNQDSITFIPFFREGNIVRLTYSNDLFKNKLFEGAALEMNIDSVNTPADNCQNNYSRDPRTEFINGIKFIREERGEGATGHELYAFTYETIHNNKCFQIKLGVGWYCCADEPSSDFTNSDLELVVKDLKNSLSTFRFLSEEEGIDNSVSLLQNGEYLSESFRYCLDHNPEGELDLLERIKLSDRIFRLPVPLEWGLGYEIRMTDAPVFGDLNDDGVEDALVILREYCGGNGNQGYLAAMINSHGSYQNVDVIALGKDRSSFNVEIESGFINVVACSYYETECDVYKIKLTNEKLEILETKTAPSG